MYKILSRKILTDTEMYSVLSDCESSSNMRHLSSTSANADDQHLLPNTPSHLLIGKIIRVVKKGGAVINHLKIYQNLGFILNGLTIGVDNKDG